MNPLIRNLHPLVLAYLVTIPFAVLAVAADIPSHAPQEVTPLRAQRFVCNLGYTPSECRAESLAVQQTAARYHGEDLGSWTWILVRSEDWKPLMERLKLNPSSPALTVLELRETLLEEALLKPNAAEAAQLMRDFRTPLNRLLDLAVTHEMGHALCRDLNESNADQYGRQLREGLRPRCAAKSK